MSRDKILTREEVVTLLDKMFNDYPWKHEINYLHATDEALRNENAALKADRDEFQSLNEHHKEQFLRVNLENVRLRELLQKIYVDLKQAKQLSVFASQALKREVAALKETA
jgi:hypothetical protein